MKNKILSFCYLFFLLSAVIVQADKSDIYINPIIKTKNQSIPVNSGSRVNCIFFEVNGKLTEGFKYPKTTSRAQFDVMKCLSILSYYNNLFILRDGKNDKRLFYRIATPGKMNKESKQMVLSAVSRINKDNEKGITCFKQMSIPEVPGGKDELVKIRDGYISLLENDIFFNNYTSMYVEEKYDKNQYIMNLEPAFYHKSPEKFRQITQNYLRDNRFDIFYENFHGEFILRESPTDAIRKAKVRYKIEDWIFNARIDPLLPVKNSN